MKKFMIFYLAPMPAEEQMKMGGPEARAKMMEPWQAWFAKQVSALVDMGDPLGMAKVVTPTGTEDAKAPFVGGYSIVQAESREKVEEMVKDHPHLSMPGGPSILISEVLPMPGM